MGMASTRSGRRVGLRGNGVQLLDYRGLLVAALLFVTVTLFVIKDVDCSITFDAIAPAPTPSRQQTQPNVTFNQYEADALNAVFQMWSKQNSQLSTLLNWSLEQHPCNRTDAIEDAIELIKSFEDGTRTGTHTGFEGAWIGVKCTAVLRNATEIPKHYRISVTSLLIHGSNSDCPDSSNYQCGFDESYSHCPSSINQCGFDGIIGQLSAEISNLTNLEELSIVNNPKLTGPVPVEIFQLPNLWFHLNLSNNSLNGTLPSDVYNADCKLGYLYLSNNDFSGSLRMSSQGTLFCSSLTDLKVGFNQLDGPIDLHDWNITEFIALDFSNNRFGGTFSIGPYYTIDKLDLSCNNFTSIQLTNHTQGSTPSNDDGYMPYLSNL